MWRFALWQDYHHDGYRCGQGAYRCPFDDLFLSGNAAINRTGAPVSGTTTTLPDDTRQQTAYALDDEHKQALLDTQFNSRSNGN